MSVKKKKVFYFSFLNFIFIFPFFFPPQENFIRVTRSLPNKIAFTQLELLADWPTDLSAYNGSQNIFRHSELPRTVCE